MPSPCKHKQQKNPKGQVYVEIRHFESNSVDDIKVNEDNECSLCFVEKANKNKESLTTKLIKDSYFSPPNVYTITIPTPCSFEDLQQHLATAIPKYFGPAIIEGSDGDLLLPNLCTLKDGDKIVFREIRPSSEKDFDIQHNYKKFNDIDIEKVINSL